MQPTESCDFCEGDVREGEGFAMWGDKCAVYFRSPADERGVEIPALRTSSAGSAVISTCRLKMCGLA
jgi:hypothetical protein